MIMLVLSTAHYLSEHPNGCINKHLSMDTPFQGISESPLASASIFPSQGAVLDSTA